MPISGRLQKTMENHNLLWENYGKSQFLMGQLWKIIIFSGKTMEHHHFIAGITHFKWPCSIANILPEGRTKD